MMPLITNHLNGTFAIDNLGRSSTVSTILALLYLSITAIFYNVLTIPVKVLSFLNYSNDAKCSLFIFNFNKNDQIAF
jgi:hypothetical protein